MPRPGTPARSFLPPNSRSDEEDAASGGVHGISNFQDLLSGLQVAFRGAPDANHSEMPDVR